MNSDNSWELTRCTYMLFKDDVGMNDKADLVEEVKKKRKIFKDSTLKGLLKKLNE